MASPIKKVAEQFEARYCQKSETKQALGHHSSLLIGLVLDQSKTIVDAPLAAMNKYKPMPTDKEKKRTHTEQLPFGLYVR